MIINGKKVNRLLIGKGNIAVMLDDNDASVYGDIEAKVVWETNCLEERISDVTEFYKYPSQRIFVEDLILKSMASRYGKMQLIKKIVDTQAIKERKVEK